MPHISTDIFPQINYRKTGNGPVLVLLHGFPENGKLWDNIVSVLAHDFTIIIPDFPGSGDSAFIGEDLTMEQMADSVKAVLDKETVKEAVIAGHSMGGYAALAFMEKYPALVKGLSMVHSTAAADDEEKKEIRRKSIGIIQKGAKETFIKQVVLNLFSSFFVESNNGQVNKQIDESMKLEARGMIGFYNAMMKRPDRKNMVYAASCPFQWIIGKNDNVMPFSSSLQQCYLASINFVSVYDKCGHMSMIEQPGRLAQDIKDFATYCLTVNS